MTKKFSFLVLVVACVLHREAGAQACGLLNTGTKTLYLGHFPEDNTQAPPGYQAVFINHVGRHGSRHLTKQVNASGAWKILAEADSSGQLTAGGKRLRSLLNTLNKVEKPFVKSISAIGVMEQELIATRMYQHFPNVFSPSDSTWRPEITKELRTEQTAKAFIGAIQQLSGRTAGIVYHINDTILRFYDLSPAYTRMEDEGSWKKDIDKLKTSKGFNGLVLEAGNRIFAPAFWKGLSVESRGDFYADLYGFLSIIPSVEKEIQAAGIALAVDSIAQFFTCPLLSSSSLADAAEDFLLKGPGLNPLGLQVKIAAPLLAAFIQSTDDFVKTGEQPFFLRFSHAETIAPFAALLGLAGAELGVKNIANYNTSKWDPAKVAPLSANIQWILFRKPNTKKLLVKFLLNEKPVTVAGLKPVVSPYYDWEQVRAFYVKKLSGIGYPLNTNAVKYLEALK